MPTCPSCGEFDADELVRHERDGVVHVHCPECQHNFGVYNSHEH